MANYIWPLTPINSGSIKYDENGVPTNVSIDTVTPANSTPLPVTQLNSNGTVFDPSVSEGYLQSLAAEDFATETTSAAISSTLSTLNGKVTAVNTGNVTVTSSALPTGAATESTLNDVKTNQLSITDTGNSSTTPLAGGATFTGTGIDISNFGTISIAAFSNVDSATNGFQMQFSPDNVNWDHVHSFSVTGNVGASYNQAAELKYFRVVYTNGASAQSSFRLTTILKRQAVDPSRYSLSQAMNDNLMANVTKAAIWGHSTAGGGSYVHVKVNPSGALTADVTGTVSATQSGTWNINNISGTVSLPTGAATEATLSTLNGKVTTVDTSNVTVVGSALPTGAATETTLSALNAKVTAVNTGNVTVASSALPTGAATESTLSSINTKTPSLGQAVMASSVPVVIASNQSTLPTMQQGMSKANNPFVFYYAPGSPITTSAYTLVEASTTSATKHLSIFDSSGQPMILAVGSGGSEVQQLYVPPGGGEFDLAIPAGSRVSYMALMNDAVSGFLLINFLG